MATRESNQPRVLNKVPKKSQIPCPTDLKPACSRVKPMPNFNKLHLKWSSKLQQGKALQKKPCTVVHAFDLTRSETKFTMVSGTNVKSPPASTGKLQKSCPPPDIERDSAIDYVDSLPLRTSKSKRNLFPEPAPPSQLPASVPFKQIEFSSELLDADSDSDKENKDPEPCLVDPGRESFSVLAKQQPAELAFESDMDALHSILSNQGIATHGAPTQKPKIAAAFKNAIPSSSNKCDGFLTPTAPTPRRATTASATSARRSIYYHGPADGVNRQDVYSEQKRQAISRLTADANFNPTGVSSPLVMGKMELMDKRSINRHYISVPEVLAAASSSKENCQNTPRATQARRVLKESPMTTEVQTSKHKARRVPATSPRHSPMPRRTTGSIYWSAQRRQIERPGTSTWKELLEARTQVQADEADPLAKKISFADEETGRSVEIKGALEKLEEMEKREALLKKEIAEIQEKEERGTPSASSVSLSPKEIKDQSNLSRKRESLVAEEIVISPTSQGTINYVTPKKSPHTFCVWQDTEKTKLSSPLLGDSPKRKASLRVLSPNVMRSPRSHGQQVKSSKVVESPIAHMVKQLDCGVWQVPSSSSAIEKIFSPRGSQYMNNEKVMSPYRSREKENLSPYLSKLEDSLCGLDLHNCTLDDLNITLSESILQVESLENQMGKLSRKTRKEPSSGEILQQLEAIKRKQQKLMRLQQKLQQQLVNQGLEAVEEDETVDGNEQALGLTVDEEGVTSDQNKSEMLQLNAEKLVVPEVMNPMEMSVAKGEVDITQKETIAEDCTISVIEQSSCSVPDEILPVSPNLPKVQQFVPVTPLTNAITTYEIQASPYLSISMLKESLSEYLPETPASPHNVSVSLEELGERILHDIGHYDEVKIPSPVQPAVPGLAVPNPAVPDLAVLNRVASQLVCLPPYSPHKPMLGVFNCSPLQPMFAGSAQIVQPTAANYRITSADQHLLEIQPQLDISGSTVSSGMSSNNSSRNISPESLVTSHHFSSPSDHADTANVQSATHISPCRGISLAPPVQLNTSPVVQTETSVPPHPMPAMRGANTTIYSTASQISPVRVHSPRYMHPSPVRAATIDIGSMSLAANLKTSRPILCAAAGFHNTVVTMAAERFWDALLDDEVAQYAGRLTKGSTCSQADKKRCENPLASILREGDDKHFVPIQEELCLSTPILESAFSPARQL